MDESLKAFILRCYDERIALAEMPSEMRESLKASNRVPAFLQNLQLRVEKLPIRYQKQETIRDATYSLTDWFIEAFKKHANERMLSEVEKRALLAKQERTQIIETAIDTGEITEEVYDVITEEATKTRPTD